MDELHMGSNMCAARRRKGDVESFVPQLFILAKKFVGDYWPIDPVLQPIGRIDENPYLEKKYEIIDHDSSREQKHWVIHFHQM